MATIRQKRRGVWEVRVFVGRDDHGKPVQSSRTVHGGKKDAERVAAQLALKPVRSVGRRTVKDGSILTIDSAITVVREGEGEDRITVLRDDPTKTADRRCVALDDDTVALLTPLREKREPHAPWMFSDTQHPPNPDRVGYWWRRCRELSGIDPEWRLHA